MADNFYEKHNVAPPSSIDHGLSVDDISTRVRSVNPRNWRQEGNVLIADTDVGEMRQAIPTNKILTGTDEKGLPTFKKI